MFLCGLIQLVGQVAVAAVVGGAAGGLGHVLRELFCRCIRRDDRARACHAAAWARIRYLENMLKTATIVSDDSKDDEVGMDDIVEVYFEEDDEIEKYKLVTSIRGNSMENRISIESPIGMALKGHKVGDRVEVKVNDNYSYFLEIRSIDKTGSEDEEIRGF